MAQHARVVIGANYGDEGKGLMTDYYASQVGPSGLVVRFNGGAQAGHTVQTPDGRRHVFGHLGAGAFEGVPTLLSRYFIVNPLLFHKERKKLAALATCPRIFVDPRCVVTTPYDMLINEAVEDARGANRHGSVGVGIWETVSRSKHDQFRLTVTDLADADTLRSMARVIRERWVARRLGEHGFPDALKDRQETLMSDILLDNWIESCHTFIRQVTLVADTAAIRRSEEVIFEGAQGLALDGVHGQAPYNTPSRTGIVNAMHLCEASGITSAEVTYATRCYMTRHGAGPLPHERRRGPYTAVVDPTNVPNAYQGTLRFGVLNVRQVADRILTDYAGRPDGIDTSLSVAVTCLDQIHELDMEWFDMKGEYKNGSHYFLLRDMQDATGADRVLGSRGPTRDTVATALGLPVFAGR